MVTPEWLVGARKEMSGIVNYPNSLMDCIRIVELKSNVIGVIFTHFHCFEWTYGIELNPEMD